MNEETKRVLRNAAASSAMEGLALEQDHLNVINQILSGECTLESFFEEMLIDSVISEAEQEYREDRQLHDAHEALHLLRCKHFRD